MIVSPGRVDNGAHSVAVEQEDKKFLSINNNNNYMINNNTEYVQQQHSPQLMGQLMGDYSQATMVYGQQQQQHQVAHSPCPPRDDIMQRVTPSSPLSQNADSNSSHKITVKCAAELMQRGGGGGAPDVVGEGMRVHFKKKPENRY